MKKRISAEAHLHRMIERKRWNIAFHRRHPLGTGYGPKRTRYMPHQGQQECERRAGRRISKQLKRQTMLMTLKKY